jgi:hypothetical protein
MLKKDWRRRRRIDEEEPLMVEGEIQLGKVESI